MKAVILAGGFGTRISEETENIPKPMIKIGNMPILWHIMKIYSSHGINDFIICCGYKGYAIKEYFSNYFLHMSDVTFSMEENLMEVHHKRAEPWTITLVDTGLETMTGGRLKKIKKYLDNDSFAFTYGDGISNVDISKLIDFHKSKKTLATLTAVQPPGRFGLLNLQDNGTVDFKEKPLGDGGWINGGFFILEPEVLDYIKNDKTSWEKEPLENIVKTNQLSVFKHTGFWHAVDTLRDKNYLDKLWTSGKAD